MGSLKSRMVGLVIAQMLIAIQELEQWMGCWIIMENQNGILEVKNGWIGNRANAYCHPWNSGWDAG